MAQTFTCPNCSAPLEYDSDEPTMRCPYCNSSVIVPDSIRTASGRSSSRATPQIGSGGPWVGSSLLSPTARLNEIAQHIRIGNKVEAIRIYREVFGVGLAEAKDAVEALAAGRPVVMPGSALIGTAEVTAPSNPVFSSSFTPQAVASSSQGVTYTVSGKTTQTSFLAYLVRLSFVSLPLAFVLTMLGLVFPDAARLAAPILCPANYIDAYGEVEVSYDGDGTGYNLNLICVDAEGQNVQPNGFFFAFTLFGLYLSVSLLLAFGLAAIFRFKLAGCLPMIAILIIIPVTCIAYVSLIPSRSATNPFLQLVNIDLGETFTLSPTTSGETPNGDEPLGAEPAPGFAQTLLTFGGEQGTGPGQFNDTRAIAVDSGGSIYTADYSGGRIQVFNSLGDYVNQWTIAGDNVYISGLAVSPQGVVFAVFGGNIYQYQGTTGDPLDRVNYDGTFVQDVAVSPAGDLVAISRQEIVGFDTNGSQTLGIPDWGAAITETFSASADNLTVDGSGDIYLVDQSNNAVYKFSAGGEFINRLGEPGKSPGQLDGPTAIAVDSLGRVYIQDYQGIQVFDPKGGFLGLIEVEGLGFDLAINAQDELFFMDRNANKVFKYKIP